MVSNVLMQAWQKITEKMLQPTRYILSFILSYIWKCWTYKVEKRYTKLDGTVHADAPDILAEIETILVSNFSSFTFLSFNPSYFLTQDDDFTFALTGQPEWKREDFKMLYPKFRHTVSSKVLLQLILSQLASNGGPPANIAVPNILNPLVSLLLEVRAKPLFHNSSLCLRHLSWAASCSSLHGSSLSRQNTEIPFASALALECCNSEKLLWKQAVVVPIGGDGM